MPFKDQVAVINWDGAAVMMRLAGEGAGVPAMPGRPDGTAPGQAGSAGCRDSAEAGGGGAKQPWPVRRR